MAHVDPMVLRLQEAMQDSAPTLVEFYADWCPHCQAMMPIVAELRAKMGDRAHVIQIEGEEHEDLMREFHVDSYPTWIVFKDGQEAWRDGGEKPLSELEDMVRRFI